MSMGKLTGDRLTRDRLAGGPRRLLPGFRGPRGAVLRLVLLGLLLAVLAALLYIAGQDRIGEPVVLAALGALAGIGVFFLFSMALGFIQLTSRNQAADLRGELIDGMEAGVVVTDAEGRIVYHNPAYSRITGARNEGEVVSVEALFSRRMEAADIVYRMAHQVKAGEPTAQEFRLGSGLRTGEEGARWFRLRARPMASARLGSTLTVWQVADVTSERRSQETTFLQLQNAIHYLDHAPAGFFSSEADGSLVYINATLADWLGIDLARFEPGRVNLLDLVAGDGMALLRAVKPDVAGLKTSVIDLDLAKSDGTRLPVRLYHRVPANPDGAPGATRTLVINRLVGDSGDALRDAELRFTRFFDNSPFAIAALGADGSIRRTNAPFQRMFAAVLGSREVEDLTFRDLGSKSEEKRIEEAWRAALSGQVKIDPVELPMNAAKGRFVRIFMSPVTPLPGAPAGEQDERVVAYIMETTEQRALEEQFAQGQKMQAVGQLAGGVAHDFNNVLTAIIGFSDLLLANHRQSDPSFQDIMNIKQNANRAASLVRQLLAFSRRQTLRPQVLQLSDVLADLRMLLDRLLGEKVVLNVVHGRDVWPVKVDLSQFEQVIVNLSVNARDAMPDGGALTVRTSNVAAGDVAKRFSYKEMPAADYVLVEVEDEGTGMTAEVMEKIFEPFFSTKEVGKGTGLGLSTVYGIIKQTGGFIYVDSTPGTGTVFRVFLPRHVPEPVTEEAPPVQPAEPPAKPKNRDLTGSASVLLVEDEDAVRAFASRALAGRGYKVHEAASGVEALEVMDELAGAVDIVISDVVMPEMDGPTLYRELRKTWPDLKFVFMSGYAEDAFAKNLPDSQREQFGFLPKPFTLKQLATIVKEILDEQ